MTEIFDWLDYTDDMKDAILRDLKTRNINSEKGWQTVNYCGIITILQWEEIKW